MECAEALAAEEDEEMVMIELEAAEVLGKLARCSNGGDADAVASSSNTAQDPAIAVQQQCLDTITVAGNCEQTNQTAGCQSLSAGKLKQNANEAEKEARKLRRVLANRESARQTIRRRQAMYLELTRKAADLSEVNANLKKEKELAVEKYNSLKGRNTLLKTQMAKIKKAEEVEIQEHAKSPQLHAEIPSSTMTPMFLCNQSSLVPCFWPSIVPSSDVFPFHCASHPDIMSSSQFMMPNRDNTSCSHRGQEMGITGPGTPFFVLPVPWFLPFVAQTQSTTVHTNERQNETSQTQPSTTCSSSDTPLLEECNRLSLNLNLRPDACTSSRTLSDSQFSFPPDSGGQCRWQYPQGTVRPVESLRHTGIDINIVSEPENITQGFMNTSQEPILSPRKKPEDIFAATEARRRRKELMKLKNTHHHHFRSRE